MADAVKEAIETRDISTLRQIAAAAMSEQKLILQLLADLFECQPQRPGPGANHTA